MSKTIKEGDLMRKIKEKIGADNISQEDFFNFLKNQQAQLLVDLLQIDVPLEQLDEETKTKLGLNDKRYEIFPIYDEKDDLLIDKNTELPVVEYRNLCHSEHRINQNIHRASDYIILNEKGEVLLSKRSKNKDSYPEYREFGGGHLDLSETYEEAFYREIKEEHNIEPKDIKKISGKIKYFYIDNEQKSHIKVFQIILKDLSFLKKEDEEMDGTRWFSKEEIINEVNQIINGKQNDMVPQQIYSYLQLNEDIELADKFIEIIKNQKYLDIINFRLTS